ncbi:MAG: transglycosylase domain-containing protein, partial [Pseudomonadota bacterium]|nr:transglycosylase domain-containing protein [Pseudomonadota bacterium]
MAVKKKRKTTKSQRGRQRRTQPRGFFSRLCSTVLRLLWRLLLWSGLFSLLLLLGYGYYLDRTISKTFEGRLWSVPAQVYAQPLELFAGLELTKSHLAVELDRLGYRQQRDLTSPGTYSVTDKALQVHLRGFRYIEGFRPAQRLRLTFDNKGIRQIQDSNGEALILTRLDPAKIGSFFPSHGEDRVILTPTEIPPLLAEGLKAIEDRNFDDHPGFSVTGILRALVVNLRAGAARQGGSTLTQQLVKSYFLTSERTIERKLRELAMAVILELRFSKEALLTAYVNEIFLGQNGARAIHGFGLGAQFYFNKPINELDVAEIATLISIIRGPSYYNPFRHPERALSRRNRILDTFYSDGLIAAQTHARAIERPLGVVSAAGRGGAYYPAFMDLVRSELSQRYSSAELRSQGLRIFTTLQPRLQENAQQAVSQTLSAIERDRGLPTNSLQAASVISDSQTGEVLALVGGRQGRVDGFNRALNAQRSVGSVIKPVTVL